LVPAALIHPTPLHSAAVSYHQVFIGGAQRDWAIELVPRWPSRLLEIRWCRSDFDRIEQYSHQSVEREIIYSRRFFSRRPWGPDLLPSNCWE
jgi:hypothetical protein